MNELNKLMKRISVVDSAIKAVMDSFSRRKRVTWHPDSSCSVVAMTTDVQRVIKAAFVERISQIGLLFDSLGAKTHTVCVQVCV